MSTNSRHLSVPFTAPDAWTGGYYELAIELGPRSDERLIAAHRAVWAHPDVEGCYDDWHVEPDKQPKLSPSGDALFQPFRGIAHLPDHISLPAGTFIVRESDGPDGELLGVEDASELRPDWLGFFIPVGALASVYPVGGWPFGDEAQSRVWREPLNSWLAGVGTHVFRAIPLRLALIGTEVSGDTYSNDLRRTGVPQERWIDYLWPEDGQLRWYRFNRP